MSKIDISLIKEYIWNFSVILVSLGCFVNNNAISVVGLVLIGVCLLVFKENVNIKEAWQQPLIKGTCLCVVAFIGFYALSSFLNGSLRGLQEAVRYIERVAVGIIFLFLTYKRKQVLLPVLIGALIGVAIMDGYTAYYYVKEHVYKSFLDNRNNFGAWCILVLPCLCIWLKNISLKWQIPGWIIVISTVLLLVITGSRGALVGGIAMLTVVIYCNRNNKKMLVGSLLFMLVAGATIAYYYGSGKLRMIHGAGVYGDRERMLLLCTGWQIFLEHPLLGVGYEGWWQFYAKHYIYVQGNPMLTTPHNIVLDYLDRVGIIGSLGLWTLWWSQLKSLYNNYSKSTVCKDTCLLMLLVMVGMFVHGMVDIAAMNRYFMVLYSFIWAVTVHEIMSEDR